jgi:hypothetical protein
VFTEISIKGKPVRVPCVEVQERKVIASGKFPRLASIADEEWIESTDEVNPEELVSRLKSDSLRADIFHFRRSLERPGQRFDHLKMEWDNAAVVPLSSYQDWWENRVPQETRKNVRRSQRRGVVVRPITLDDATVAGIKGIYDETPLRQGRPFWHYGKDLETIRRDNASYLDRSDFFGAFFEDTLIGFIKVVYVQRVARIMQILSMNAHFDKRPANALLAKAIERAVERKMEYFVYGKHIYGRKANSPVTEFKRRNGFEERRFPRYYLPITMRGRLALALGLHLGWRNLLPESALEFALRTRALLLEKKLAVAKDAAVGVPA